MSPHALPTEGFRANTARVMRPRRWLAAGAALVMGMLSALPAAATVAIDSSPLSKQSSVPGNLVLVPSVEWPTVLTQANDPGVGETSANYSTTPVTSCPAGYTLNGSTCRQTVPATPSCAAGFTLNGSSCQKTTQANASYSCPSNYSPSPSGTVTSSSVCRRTTSSSCYTGYTKTSGVCSGPPLVSYSCPSGTGSLSGTNCVLTGSGPTYSCPVGTSSGSGSSMICITASTTPTTVPSPYAGYFNSELCYAYSYDAAEANRYFYPVVAAGENFSCEGKTHAITLPDGGTRNERLWSGNYLNWVSMQAIDTFRLALTGGYRVHRPAEGTPPNVNVVGSNGTSSSWATSEMPNTTYLEKANSDRWDDSYVKLRRLASGSGTSQTVVRAATPYYDGTTGVRARIGALRNQMWFAPTADFAMGAGRSYSDPRALSLPITDGDQTEPGGATGTGLPAIPYNPAYHTLPNADTSTSSNSTACGADEPGCSGPTYSCSTGTLSGANCVTSTSNSVTTNPAACTVSNRLNYRTGTKKCHQNNNDTSSSVANSCPAESDTTVGNVRTVVDVTLPSSSGTGKTCTVKTTTTTTNTSAATVRYQHTAYGRNQVYAVSIRVKVCDGTLDTRDICTQYGSNYKPEGLLQKNARKIRYSLFSYLTETGQQRQGGVMRARQKLIGPLSAAEIAGTEKPYPDRERISGIDNPEWDPATGVFLNNPDSTDATATNTNIGSCTAASTPDGSGCQVQYSGVINYLNRFGQILTGQPTLKSYDNLSELYYTALRYLRGLANIQSFSNLTKASSGSDLSGTGSVAKYQNADGLPVIDDWYKTGANAAVTNWASNSLSTGSAGDPMLYQCQTTVVLGIGDTSTQSEDDSNERSKDSNAPADTWRAYTDYTAGAGRGNVAGLAYWAHLNDLRADVPNNDIQPGSKRGQTISTYWVDVVERNDLFAKSTNQYYNATKFGGYTIPPQDWGADGNATRHDLSWFDTNKTEWTNKQNTIKTETGLGGTGDFYLPNNMYLANNGQKMIAGLNSAFQKIAEDLIGSGSSLAANSTRLDNDTTTFQAVYYTGDWRGDLKAMPVNLDGSINSATTWEASKQIPIPAERKILTCTGTGICSTSVEFKTDTTFDTKSDLGANLAAQDAVIKFLRGDQTVEVQNGGTLRNRASKLGDIVNSQPVFVAAPSANLYKGKSFATAYSAFAGTSSIKTRTKAIYVAANDGMLHAFNVGTGRELFAYLPRAVIKSGIRKISQTTYGDVGNPHQFWNDGEMVIADVECASTDCPNAVGGWATVLVGTTGRGPSKAIYALDVTNPEDPELLWERSAGDSGSGSNYIGQIIGKPVIARISADGDWVVLLGNGYNSSYGKPALLQIDIGSGALSAYTTTGDSDDGLAQPAVWISDDTVEDNVSTSAYAGDLNGKVWAFTLAASGGAGTQVFAAKNGTKAQPITAGMIVAKNPEDDQVWVFFGTGEFLSSFKSDDGLQTWYGLIVEGANKVGCTSGTCTARDELMERTIIAESDATDDQFAARGISAATEDDMVDKKGWFIDLLVDGATTETGERMVTPNQFRGSLLIGTSRLPTNDDPCNPSGGGWIMALNPFTGAPPDIAFFDINGSGNFTDDFVDGTTIVAAGIGFGSIPNNPIFVSHTMLVSFDNGSTDSFNTRPNGEGDAARLSWRELVTE